MGVNNEKAERAKTTLRFYSDFAGQDHIETQTIDLLTDIMHLCKRHRLSFNQLLSTAKAHYSSEEK
jgi:hypothetical protein